jgi:hypothetical protein
MIRTDLSSQYKTKHCKKYLANGYCPYGKRCLFIHEAEDTSNKENINQTEGQGESKNQVSKTQEGYAEMLVHCINVSLQEHQKKLSVYNRKVFKHKEKKSILPSPGLQYMNIHSKTSPRLCCFTEICDNSKDHVKGFIHGNASSYEAYLESLIK